MTEHKQNNLHNRPDGNGENTIDDERAVAKLRAGLDGLVQHMPVFTPSQAWFLQQIEERKKLNRKRLTRDLSIFVLVAVTILSVFISVTIRQPAVFLIAQLVSIVAVPIVLFSLLRKRVDG